MLIASIDTTYTHDLDPKGQIGQAMALRGHYGVLCCPPGCSNYYTPSSDQIMKDAEEGRQRRQSTFFNAIFRLRLGSGP